MMKAEIEECKNKIARANNFDSFKTAIRYAFNRVLFQSEDEFINKIINESMEEYTSIKCKELEEENEIAHEIANHIIDNKHTLTDRNLLMKCYKLTSKTK